MALVEAAPVAIRSIGNEQEGQTAAETRRQKWCPATRNAASRNKARLSGRRTDTAHSAIASTSTVSEPGYWWSLATGMVMVAIGLRARKRRRSSG
jgi:hypothetical protein